MKKGLTARNVLATKFNTLGFDGVWRDAVGDPQLTGSWIIYGDTKNGKTTFAMMLSKYLSGFGRVAYNSVEEGNSRTIQMAVDRAGLLEAGARWMLLDRESKDELCERLRRQRSADIVFIDSVQFMDLKFSEYKDLKRRFPTKLFVYISHVDGRRPSTPTALRILRDANVAFRIEGFKAFPTSRYGGGRPVVIWDKGADEYWGREKEVGAGKAAR
ncbi:hypothetical protein T229_07990 [Tannerella sp. oral taxon BU063 isolate Cell 5]|uniref:AAA+ ATPase domain-containing protein n=1 Tax=Tannerella sp. oral taxon BU063 isolate Cell 5 TaxID=1410950 RepID=W2CDR7_9BACT|nr:hypothetical protein T229_07990 [Tannerella sp. oral taxon BU063 isolate Cell 5]